MCRVFSSLLLPLFFLKPACKYDSVCDVFFKRKLLSIFLVSAGDSLSVHNGMAFSTYDRDNDRNARLNCAVESHGGWWYNSCYESNLNGQYFNFDSRDFTGIHWFQLGKVPMAKKYTEMKIRRN